MLRYKSAKGEDQTNELYIDSRGSAFFFISAIMDGCVRPECPHRSNRSNTEDHWVSAPPSDRLPSIFDQPPPLSDQNHLYLNLLPIVHSILHCVIELKAKSLIYWIILIHLNIWPWIGCGARVDGVWTSVRSSSICGSATLQPFTNSQPTFHSSFIFVERPSNSDLYCFFAHICPNCNSWCQKI